MGYVALTLSTSRKKWWKEADHREELPDYPERATTEIIVNAIIHRDYMVMGSEVHIDLYDDRLEVYSPGGMMDGSLIQNVDPAAVTSRRRNPLLADFFSRLGLVERRGSGMMKIINAYKQYERLTNCRMPEFRSNATEFHVTLWNMNYDDSTKEGEEFTKKFIKEKEFIKGSTSDYSYEGDGTAENRSAEKFIKGDHKRFVKEKEFIKASRLIYRLVSLNPKITAAQMAETMKVTPRQVLKYIRQLKETQKIARVGGRKTGYWKITDEEYDSFFDRI